jgi:ABC-type Mn2+/Zn2+ transport system permease subunit
VRLEAGIHCELLHRSAHLSLERGAGRHVGHLSAADAEQVVVVVLGEVLRQLEAREAIAWRPLLLSTVVPDVADARGIRSRPTEIAFLLVVAAATTVTLPVVGALLTYSLMIGPPAAARSLTRRPQSALVLSVVFALLTAWLAIASCTGRTGRWGSSWGPMPSSVT